MASPPHQQPGETDDLYIARLRAATAALELQTAIINAQNAVKIEAAKATYAELLKEAQAATELIPDPATRKRYLERLAAAGKNLTTPDSPK